jgi:hypothetical protein
VTELTARAGRARHRRTAWVSGAVAAGLLVVAGTGYAATRWDRAAEPLPADTPTVAPSPTPTPDAPGQVLPTGDASLPFGECGSLVGSPTEPAADPEASLTLTASPVALGGQAVEISTTLVPPPDARRGFQRASGPRAVVVQDGVVVSVVDVTAESAEPDLFLRASSVEFVNTIPTTVVHRVPVVCDGAGGTPGAALPAGDYQVIAVGELWWSDSDPETESWPDAETVQALAEATGAVHATALSTPVPLSISAEQIDPATVVPPSGEAPTDVTGDTVPRNACQTPVPGTTIPGFSTGGSGDQVDVVAGGTIPFGMTLGYTGPGRVRWGSLSPSLTLLRNGTVVGVVEGVDSRTVDGDAGTTQTLTGEATGALICENGWTVDTWTPEPGVYQAIPWTTVWIDRFTDAAGDAVALPTPVGQGLGSTVVGAPFTLVVG